MTRDHAAEKERHNLMAEAAGSTWGMKMCNSRILGTLVITAGVAGG